MIRKTLLVLITLAFIVSCDNDIDIIAEWKDIPVVYGVLNAQDSVHYVKLNKAFLGQGNVMSMAQEFDSLYYDQEDVGLRLVEYRRIAGQYIETKSIEMEPTDEFLKPLEGIFSAPDQIIYKSDASLNNERYYSAQVYDKSVDTVIASNLIPIDVLSPLQIIKPNPASALNLVPNGNYPITVEWSPLEGADLYELKIRFHYVEQQIANLSDTVHKYIDWNFPYRLPTSSISSESISLDAEQFLNFLAVNIDENPNVYRQVKGMQFTQTTLSHACMDITLMAAGQNLSTYILLNQNSNSIVVDRLEYSNIDNGIGVLSSRSFNVLEGIKINNFSNDEIAFNEITKHLNFAYFEFDFDDGVDTLYVN
tara:strand:+ start:3460 stop:4554 length:1095 start_codon:yes stop_codon:yes gene_type:complete